MVRSENFQSIPPEGEKMSIENRYTLVQGIQTRYWSEGNQGSHAPIFNGTLLGWIAVHTLP